MMMQNKKDFEDDGRVVADMSEIDPQPLLIPRFKARGSETEQPAEHMAKEDRNAFIKGSIAAGLLVGAVFALAFAAVIFLIGHIG